ncbi:integrase [Caulobacter zeae]|uniref:Integrase n=1 Tax=Caulobacter zeae TaxID=2055137 RepID=A0A2N5D4J8_9CAUL|nr:site-specific integrase [Caulobacter zeae]PLR20989.1 integrase [Caulobacter zeae]
MTRVLERLSPLQVRRLTKPGFYADGGGLNLQVMGEGGRSWIFRYEVDGKERRMGLGPVNCVSLAEARLAAEEARKLRRAGLDPLEERRKVEVAEAIETGSKLTFDEAVDAYIKANKAAWRNEKHQQQWKNSLTAYASPKMGKLLVGEIDTDHVRSAIEPIWATKTETASRVRGRIESVLDWATVLKYRMGDNPARWTGHLDQVLPAKGKVKKVRHHAALPYAELPKFMARLRKLGGVAARALEFTILTCARSGEVFGLDWSEIDLAKKVWIVPAERMKAEREHRIPLSPPAIAILEQMRDLWLAIEARRWKGKRSTSAVVEPHGPVFFGQKAGKGLSNMAMLKVIKKLGHAGLTTHGFRSTFSDWAAETTNYPPEMIEMALAHTIASKVEAAYRRGDLFAKRHALMADWAKAAAQATAKAA